MAANALINLMGFVPGAWERLTTQPAQAGTAPMASPAMPQITLPAAPQSAESTTLPVPEVGTNAYAQYYNAPQNNTLASWFGRQSRPSFGGF